MIKYCTKLDNKHHTILVEEKEFEYSYQHFNEPSKVNEMMCQVFDMHNLAEEFLYMIALDVKCKILGVFEVSHGTIDMSLVGSREIFIRALLCGAKNIILIHNHPSGETHPSREDKHITEKIRKAGELLDINLIDHIIIGAEGFLSFSTEELF